MKILITAPYKINGGIAIYLQSLEKNFNLDVTYFKRGSHVSSLNKVYKLISHFYDFLKFLGIVLWGHYDVVFINTSLGVTTLLRDSIFVCIAKLSGKKVVLFIHGWNSDFAARMRKIYLLGYFKSDSIIVLANEFKEQLEKWGYSKPIYKELTVVSDEISESVSLNKLETLRDSYKFNILFLSRVEEVKGVFEAIKTYEILKESFPFIRLNIAGEGMALDAAIQFVHENRISGITFSGFVKGNDKIDAFKNADLYLFPTFHGEGCPISVLEAMMFGLPVVTRYVGGLSDFFENGKMGFITDSKDPSVFAEFVERIIADKEIHKDISLYNYSFARNNFVANSAVERLERIISDC